MIKKIILVFISIVGLSQTNVFAQGFNPPQYPYYQSFDSLVPFQYIEGQAAWLNGDFFGIDPSTVSVYAGRGMAGSQSMSMMLSDNTPTDSIITPLIGSLHAGAYISFYYRIVDVNGQAVSLTGNGGLKLQMKQDIAPDWILIDSISVSNHIESSDYRKIVHTLPTDSINVNFRFSFYQGALGQDLYIDIDSLVVTDDQLITAIQNNNTSNFLIQNNELNQIMIKSNNVNSINGIVNIFDINGKLIHNATLISNNSVDASQWSKGVYFVQVIEQNKHLNKKIIVR